MHAYIICNICHTVRANKDVIVCFEDDYMVFT